MNSTNKRKNNMEDDKKPKRVRTECSYGNKCYRKNPAHLREFSHPHLEAILDAHTGGEYVIPPELSLQRPMILEQLEIITEKQLYVPSKKENKIATENRPKTPEVTSTVSDTKIKQTQAKITTKPDHASTETSVNVDSMSREKNQTVSTSGDSGSKCKVKDSDYRPIVPPTRRAADYLTVLRPAGGMAAKHAASEPYCLFYTTITAAPQTHSQPYSITFQEILDRSLGELKCSLQINFMVEPGWLLAQYYFAGYSEKKLTIIYGEECSDLKNISSKKPQVEAYHVPMGSPFAKHHTKMMILCYEDGSLRVVVSTANLYLDDWENRTQGLWFSPRCPELPAAAPPHAGESPTQFKKYLLKYLAQYRTPMLSYYVERVKRCDFSHINVFLVSSAPGGHFDTEWGMTRAGALLRQHCAIPTQEQTSWPLLAQASSIGSYGKEPRLWLTGDFLHHFTKIKEQPQTLTQPPQLQLIYPSLDNVRQSHDGLLGGGCLPYSADAHFKQPWLNTFLYQWKATSSHRNKAMPHIKSYTRTSPDHKRAAFYLLTSGNVSKAAWGNLNKGNAALRIMSFEAGVMFLPKFVINEDFFPLDPQAKNRLVIPYDIPPTKYTSDMIPWVQDYLR
ncbi:tyrosyl-DNA phosphodiesterase glaikit isoform X1 [Choristoneura fumiferana]|uniref:tyrosyl-DNA phosphodiesterase glaikit isoform X1 n=1 Tax=Choristoneura fumiferana TaxID=7141 RepID=UPI003D158D7E